MCRKLLPWKQNSAATEKERLAMVRALKKLQQYLLGPRFTVYTDHAPLTRLHQMKGANAKLLRWRLQLQDYTMEVIHVNGRAKVRADDLLRRGGQELPQATG
ncbi:unnamed protein product [Eretmochelys imbricata]